MDETVRPSPMKMRTRSKARPSFVIPDADICSDVEDDEPRPRQRKRNIANATMPRAGGTSNFFRRNSKQFTCVASKALAARKSRAGTKGRKRPSSRMRVRGGRLEPDDDIEFFLRVTNFFPFQSSVHAVGYRTSKLRLWTAPRLTVMIKPQGLLWAQL